MSCPVCFEDADTVTLCKHAFCHKCITQWMLQENSCPLCRLPLIEPLSTFQRSGLIEDVAFDSRWPFWFRKRARFLEMLGYGWTLKVRNERLSLLIGFRVLFSVHCRDVKCIQTSDTVTELSVRVKTRMRAIRWTNKQKVTEAIERWFEVAAASLA